LIWTEPLADKAFIDTAKAIKSLIEFHEKTPEYLSQTYQSLVQSCTNFTKYEKILAIKKLNEILQKIHSLMTEPFLY